MKPLSLEIKNFTVYRKAAIDFTIDGIYVVYGKDVLTHKRNAIGKTGIAEAIRYALYGETKYKDLDKPISFGEKEMSVSFKFLQNDKKYCITRTRTRNKNTSVQLFEDGNDLGIEKIADLNKFLVRLIGVSNDVFLFSFYLNKGSKLEGLTTTKLINFLKSILKLQIFDNYRERAKECYQTIDKKIDKLLVIKETLDKLATFQMNKKELKEQRIRLESYIIKFEVLEKQAIKKVNEKRQAQSSDRVELSSIRTEIGKAKKQLQFIEETGTCPTCKRDLRNDSIEKDLRKKLKELSPVAEELDEKVKQLQNLILEIDNSVYSKRENYTKAQNKLTQINYHLKLKDECSAVNQEGIDKEYKKLIELRTIAEECITLFSPTELPLFILNEYLPLLEIAVNQILESITDFSIEIITEKTTKSTGKVKKTCELVLYRRGQKYDVVNLSGGEEALINMAFRIGISKIFLQTTDFQMLIVDECLGSLGEVNQQIAVQMLKDLKKSFNKILIVSHVDFIRDNLSNENQIEIKKSGNISNITQNGI